MWKYTFILEYTHSQCNTIKIVIHKFFNLFQLTIRRYNNIYWRSLFNYFRWVLLMFQDGTNLRPQTHFIYCVRPSQMRVLILQTRWYVRPQITKNFCKTFFSLRCINLQNSLKLDVSPTTFFQLIDQNVKLQVVTIVGWETRYDQIYYPINESKMNSICVKLVDDGLM